MPMEDAEFDELARRASDLVVAGEHEQAIEVLEKLVHSDRPDFDRAMMCLNIAIVCDQLGDSKRALEQYNRAIDIERPTGSYYIAQHKAVYLSKLGMHAESSRSFQELLRHPKLTPESRDAFEQNIATLARLRAEQEQKDRTG